MCLLGKMWFNPLFRKAVFQLGRNAEILFLAFIYCLYGVRGQASVILLCGSQNGKRGFRLGRKCCQPLWLQSWGVSWVPPWQSLLCCWGRQVGWEGTWNTPSPFGQRNLGEKEDRPDLLTVSESYYQSFLFTVKKQVYSNVVLSSYMGQNSSGTLLEESHRKKAVWIASRALQMWVAWSDRQKML